MPGIEARAPERTDTSSGLVPSPKVLPASLADIGKRLIDLTRQFLRIGLAVGVEMGADFGGDGEARRDRQAEIGHFGKVCTLAAEQVLHVRLAFGLAAAEAVNPFRHHRSPSY